MPAIPWSQVCRDDAEPVKPLRHRRLAWSMHYEPYHGRRGTSRPVVIHGVQHLMFPPRHLDRLPDGQRGSNLVFIVDAMDPERILRSLHRFMEQQTGPLAA